MVMVRVVVTEVVVTRVLVIGMIFVEILLHIGYPHCHRSHDLPGNLVAERSDRLLDGFTFPWIGHFYSERFGL